MRHTQTILVAEEDPATRQFLLDNLTADDYEGAVGRSRCDRSHDFVVGDVIAAVRFGGENDLVDAGSLEQ